MFSRSIRLFAILTLYLAFTTQASWFDGSIFGRHNAVEIEKKQLASVVSGIASAVTSVLLGTGGSDSATTSSPAIKTSVIPTSSTLTTTSDSATPTTSNTPTTENETHQVTSTVSTIPQTSTTPTSDVSQSQSSDSSESQMSQTPTVVLVTSIVTQSGSVYTSVSSSTDTSSIPKATSGASLNNNGTTSSSGMSSKTKTTVIGVVVGIGGAIILAGLAIVAWRIWGRKKDNDDDDGLMGYRAGSGHEKTSSISNGTAPNPFQSTLESYHGPTKPVNASSNF